MSVDLTDLDRRLFLVRQSMPVKAGPLTLLYSQWLPGTHGPNGPVNLLAGLIITARGRHSPWLRDPVNMYAFHIDVPADMDHVDLEFQFASPLLRWNDVESQMRPKKIYFATRVAIKLA